MDKFVINGPTVLKGKVKVDGSKNAALPILSAALLIDKGETVIRNVPPLMDIYTLADINQWKPNCNSFNWGELLFAHNLLSILPLGLFWLAWLWFMRRRLN